MVARPYIPSDKLHSPRLGVKVLARPRLYEQLDKSLERDVTTVVASAGFGKSVLLTGWVAQRTSPTAWLSLDASDNDWPTFVRDLALSIEILFPDGCRATLSLANALLPPTPTLLADNLLAEIGDLPGNFVLILDDYHVLKNPLVDALVTSLVDLLPRHLHLIIIPLAARWVAQRDARQRCAL